MCSILNGFRHLSPYPLRRGPEMGLWTDSVDSIYDVTDG